MSFLSHPIFALGLGAPDLALLLLRVSVGVFFAISGFHKLFNAQRHQRLVSTLAGDKVPAVWFMQWWVPFWELSSGFSLAIGLLTAFNAGVLLIVCLVACTCEARAKVAKYGPIDKAYALDDYLYLPEVLYVLMLLATICAGPGQWSIDHLLRSL